MIACTNFIILLVATLLTGYFDTKSVQPVVLSQKIGDAAWSKYERIVASLLR